MGLCICKPGPVSTLQRLRPGMWTSTIYLGLPSPTGSSNLPARIERTTLSPEPCGTRRPGLFGLTAREVYQAADVATGTGGLLPHLFILTSALRRVGGLPFCGTFCSVTVPSDAPSR